MIYNDNFKKEINCIGIAESRQIIYSSMESDCIVPHFRIERDILDLLEISDYKKSDIFKTPFKKIKLDFKWEDKVTNIIYQDIYLTKKSDGFTISCSRNHIRDGVFEFFCIDTDDSLNTISQKNDWEFKDKSGKKYNKENGIDHFFNGNREDYAEHSKDMVESEERAIVIVGNFLNYINSNSCNIEYINNTHKENYIKKKLKAGKIPSLLIFNIKLKDKERKYFNNQKNICGNNFNFRFWVRGHWMEFKHPRYKNKQGQKTWILPYIKGKGELIKKDYYVGEMEQHWVHEAEMIKKN